MLMQTAHRPRQGPCFSDARRGVCGGESGGSEEAVSPPPTPALSRSPDVCRPSCGSPAGTQTWQAGTRPRVRVGLKSRTLLEAPPSALTTWGEHCQGAGLSWTELTPGGSQMFLPLGSPPGLLLGSQTSGGLARSLAQRRDEWCPHSAPMCPAWGAGIEAGKW